MWIERLLVSFLNKRRASVPAGPPEGMLLGHAHRGGRLHPVRFPTARRCEHMVVVGKTGMGKTHFLEHLAFEHMRRGEGLLFLDYHGDAITVLTELASRVSGASNRLVVIDPSHPTASPGLNPLELTGVDPSRVFARVSELSTILRARWGVEAFGPRTEETLRATLYLLAASGLTLVEAPLVLTSTALRHELTARLPSADMRLFWQERFEPLSDAMKRQLAEPLLNKITGFLTEPAVRHVLGQARGTIRFDEHMARGHWVLVNLNKGRLREHAHTLGNLIFAKLSFDVLARSELPPKGRRLFTIVCDEVQNLAENDLATLLTEGRKFGVSLVTANQFWEQLPRQLRGALLATGTQTFFRLSTADAKSLAPELSASGSPKNVVALTELGRGEAIVRVGNGLPTRITIPALPDGASEQSDRARELYSLSISQYAKDRQLVEAEIEHRRRRTPQQDTPDSHAHVTTGDAQDDW